MPDHLDVIVTLSPSFLLGNQPAGGAKQFLVKVSRAAMEKIGSSSTQSSIARELATDTALKAHAAKYGIDSKIRHDIHTQLLAPGWTNPRALESPQVFNECSIWDFTEAPQTDPNLR
jgi:hypothetical protein